MSKKKLFAIIAIITILVTTTIVSILVIFLYRTTIALQFNKSNQNFESKLIKIESLINKLVSSTLSTEDSEKVKNYKDHYDNYLTESGLDWGDDNFDKFILLCDFATRMVKFYKDNINGKLESKIYLEIANDIIHKINKRVFEKGYTVITKDTSHRTLIHLTRLLITFEYLAGDSYPDTKDICHKQILYLMPDYNKIYQGSSLAATVYLKNEQVIYTIIPRLLTNMRSDKALYNIDVKNQNVLQELKKQFDILEKSPEKSDIILKDYHFEMYKALTS
ncbi:uncharacterized protein LOC130671887 [Microplitis mediator]|uniref:uncharacterized protein LOC130671887 n=1 Tax=Microplitis mediator TaxID=375433 RepID=UPI0025526063|nr:uncharacterized protein LOC130671887 [Microplitis mediator]